MRRGGASHLARRLVLVAPALLMVMTASFALIHLAPGSPINVLAGDQPSLVYQAELTRKFGLDRPLPEQYVRYAGALARGDLGRSLVQGRPVTAVIGERIPATLLLVVPALVLSALIGIAIGVMAAQAGPAADRTLVVLSLAGQAVPVFVVGVLAVLLFSVTLGQLPVVGMRDLRESYTGFDAVLDLLRHMALPVTTLALGHVAVMARLTRSGVRRELAHAYALTARAKGLASGQVVWRHVLRNAANPVLTALGNEAAVMLGGAVLTERIFGWPGLGQLTLESALARDYPVLLGIVLLTGFTITAVNLVVDLLHPIIDPRLAS